MAAFEPPFQLGHFNADIGGLTIGSDTAVVVTVPSTGVFVYDVGSAWSYLIRAHLSRLWSGVALMDGHLLVVRESLFRQLCMPRRRCWPRSWMMTEL